MSSKKKTARDNHFYKVLGAFVKDLREKRKLTRDEAADILAKENIHVEIIDLLRSRTGIAVPDFLSYILVPRSESTILLIMLKNKFSNVSKSTY
jgi:hypothetical protein